MLVTTPNARREPRADNATQPQRVTMPPTIDFDDIVHTVVRTPGVLHAAFLHPDGKLDMLRELIATAGHLRRLLGPAHAIAMDLVATSNAVREISNLNSSAPKLWDQLREMNPPSTSREHSKAIEPYLFKLKALSESRFSRTLFLDCDVVVVEWNLVGSLLGGVLDVADVAMPLDPGRAAWLAEGGSHAPWVAPAVTPPMLCTAVMAYRQSAQVLALFKGAMRRLLEGRHAHVRRGDQEMLWFEWTRGSGANLRVLSLPEEIYCPMETRRSAPPAEGQRATWTTSWPRGKYPCRAIHSHRLAQALFANPNAGPLAVLHNRSRE